MPGHICLSSNTQVGIYAQLSTKLVCYKRCLFVVITYGWEFYTFGVVITFTAYRDNLLFARGSSVEEYQIV